MIAVTPKVIRSPAILPDDTVERPTGTLATPTNGSLEAMVIQEERDELLAQVRQLLKDPQVQLPDQPAQPEYIRGGTPEAAVAKTDQQNTEVKNDTPTTAVNASTAMNLQPIDTGLKTVELKKTSDTSIATPTDAKAVLPVQNDEASKASAPTSSATAELSLPGYFKEMKAGEKTIVPVMVKSTAFRSAMLGLQFDPAKVGPTRVTYGDVFGESMANISENPFINQGGKMFVTLSLKDPAAPSAFGILAYVEIEALVDGRPGGQARKERP